MDFSSRHIVNDAQYITSVVIQRPRLRWERVGPVRLPQWNFREILLKAVGVIFVDAAILGLLFGSEIGLDSYEGNLLFFGALAALGFLCFVYWSEEMCPELHIDDSKGELRVGIRTGRGDFQTNATYLFEEIVDIYLQPSDDSKIWPSLNLVSSRDDEPRELIRGKEDFLISVLRHIEVRKKAFCNYLYFRAADGALSKHIESSEFSRAKVIESS